MPGAGQLDRALPVRILVGCGATLAAASAFGLPWLIGHGPARTLRCVGSAAVRINCLFLAPTEPALSRGLVPLLGPEDLDRCAGSADHLFEEIDHAMARTGLTWPTS